MNTVLVTTGFLQSVGGVQSVERILHSTLTDLAFESGGKHVTCSLRDASELTRGDAVGGRVLCASGSRARLVRQVAWQCVLHTPRTVLFSHVHLARMAPLLRLLCPGARIAVVVHGIEVWRPLDVLTAWGIRCASDVWCVSKYTAQQLVQHNPTLSTSLWFLPNVIKVPAASAGSPSDDSLALLSVCRHEQNERKGVDLALRAHALLLEEFPGLQYRIGGAGNDLERLKGLAEDLGTSDRVSFLGRLSDRALGVEYERCTVFVLPSRNEGFGIVFLEAMARQKPVVAAAAAGVPEVVLHGECGLLVAPNDLLGLYEALRRLLQDSTLRDQMGANGRTRVESLFTADRFKDRVTKLLLGQGDLLDATPREAVR